MVAITEVPDLPSADIQMMIQAANIFLNEIILGAFCNGMVSPASSVIRTDSNLELTGMYTGIVAIALWSVC